MLDDEAKARQKLEEAEKKAKKTGGFLGGLFGGLNNNVIEACELYVQAGNAFKVAKNWNASGNAFLKAAELSLSQGDAKHDAALRFADAANSFRKVDIQKAIDCYQKNTEIFTDMGKFTMAAKGHISIAELYEERGGGTSDKEKSVLHYQKAADFYKGEESKSMASKSLIKVAMLSAELGQYKTAIDVFEEVGLYEADHATLKYNAKTPFFHALLCSLCLDVLDTQLALKRYEDASPHFAESRECKFIKELLLCVEEKNADQFTDAVRQYDKISRLDPWHTALLVKIKRTCESVGGEDCEDEEDIT